MGAESWNSNEWRVQMPIYLPKRPGDRDLLRRITALRRLSAQAASSRKRDALYPYVESIRNTDCKFRKRKVRKKASIRLAKLAGVAKPARIRSPIQRLIVATSDFTPKAAGKMTQAIKYANYMGWSDLQRELKRNGGIAGCATKYAALRRRSK
jgi:hypothetical protein